MMSILQILLLFQRDVPFSSTDCCALDWYGMERDRHEDGGSWPPSLSSSARPRVARYSDWGKDDRDKWYIIL